jgi:hypothetical protein
LTERASLRVWNLVKAASGIGVERATLLLLPPPPPDEPCPEVLDDPEREVPPVDTVALEEMLLFVLVLESTVALEPVVEDGESAELELTLDVANEVFVFAETNADVEDAGVERPTVEDGESNPLLEDDDAEAPAPDDDPAVLDAAVWGLLVEEDWM